MGDAQKSSASKTCMALLRHGWRIELKCNMAYATLLAPSSALEAE
jgi:hypothetical protein